MKLSFIKKDNDCTVITLSNKKIYLIKNIILELFILGSLYAPLSTNIMWCIIYERDPALGTFFNTLYFFAAGAVFAWFSDKWWNIPFLVYVSLTIIASASGILFPESGFYEACEIFIMPTYWGVYYFDVGVLSLFIILTYAIAIMLLMIRRYTRLSIYSQDEK